MSKQILIILLCSLSLHAAENKKLNERDVNGNTPLMIALKNDDPDTALTLIKTCDAQGKLLVDVTKANNKKQTPLHCAAADGYDEVIKALLARDDVDIERKDGESLTALEVAIHMCNTSTALLLLDAGANPNVGNPTALHVAAAYSNREVAQKLIDKGADLFAKCDGFLPADAAQDFNTKLLLCSAMNKVEL